MKIQIIGYSGSGKSTLAKLMSEFYKIPCLHLDNVQFYGDWQERSISKQNEIVKEFLNQHDDWVIDGNYSKVCPERFELSDITIYLNYDRFYCFNKCQERYQKYAGTSRESNPCVEKFDLEFQKWILWEGRTLAQQQKHLENLSKTKGQAHMFKRPEELHAWLKEQDILVDDQGNLMTIGLKAVKEEEKEVLSRFLQYSLYEESATDDNEINEQGFYDYPWFEDYFKDPKREAYFIIDENSQKRLGFVMIHPYVSHFEESYTIAEFMILPKYRHLHIGKRAALKCFDLHHGNWEVSPSYHSQGAYRFWQKTIASCHDRYQYHQGCFLFENK